MARVIKIDDKQEKEVTHKNCGAVIGYFPFEVQQRTYKDYTGDSDIIYFIKCPHCGAECTVNRFQ